MLSYDEIPKFSMHNPLLSYWNSIYRNINKRSFAYESLISGCICEKDDVKTENEQMILMGICVSILYT